MGTRFGIGDGGGMASDWLLPIAHASALGKELTRAGS
jgi:hypothetical protein